MRSQTAPSPTLAGRVGTYREAAPLPLLRRHFKCVWTNSVRPDHIGPIAVVPDACVDLIWRDGRLSVAGPDVVAATPLLQPGTTIIGVRFQAGAAAHWLGLPMSEIVGQGVNLSEFWGQRARDFSDRIGDGPSIAERARIFQSLLLDMTPEIESPARDIAAAFDVMQRHASDGGSAISRALDRLDISSRTFRRRCREHFGYGPKTLDRILRFQKFLALAHSRPGAALAQLAFDAGYADQAHLSRDVRELAGLTPAALVRQYAA